MNGIKVEHVLKALAVMADARNAMGLENHALAMRIAEAEGALRGSLMNALPERAALADAA